VTRVLLTVSGTVDPDVAEQVAEGRRPRPDYVELAAAMGAERLDVADARRRAGRWGRVVERLAGRGVLLAWVCFRERRRYDAIFTDGEQVGLPLAWLCRLTARALPAHVMIVHIMSVPKKAWLYRLFRLGRYIDTMVVYSMAQRRYIAEELGFPADRVVWTPFTVDTRFFSPAEVTARPRRMICTAGLEFRDYPTLIEAVRDLDVDIVIAAASNWSKRADTTAGAELPPNVEVCSLGYVELRQLYADAEFVVMPLQDVEFQAGITTILEAMAMSKAVICSRTKGQTDVIVDGTTGVYVGPGEAWELRDAIAGLLDDPDRATRIGAAARRYAEEQCDVAGYAERLAGVVTDTIDRRAIGSRRGTSRSA
jgi:glycosyltransferase involved in cell wall biosynthesis